MDHISLENKRSLPPAPHVATLLVSVFLVLLCFFIVLSSHSQTDAKRRKAVLNSVNRTFSAHEKKPASGLPLPTDAVDPASVNEFFNDVKISIATRVPLHEMKITLTGNIMILTLPSLSLFARENSKLRKDRTDFYAILSDILSRWQDSAEISIRMVQNIPSNNGAVSTLAIARAGNFARFLENRGVPPRRIAVATSDDTSDTISLIFDVAPLSAQEKP